MPINKIVISGNLSQDPEFRISQAGYGILNMKVVVDNHRKNPQTGEWENNPSFVPCVMFGDRTQKISAYLHKGSKVVVCGKINQSRWEKDGEKRSRLQVIVDDIEFLFPPQPSSPQEEQQPVDPYADIDY